jgi:hypothetical protein
MTSQPPKHYSPFPQSAKLWMFTTPVSEVRNITSGIQAAELAKTHRKQDIEKAYSDMESPTANTLRNYFDSLTAPAPTPETV